MLSNGTINSIFYATYYVQMVQLSYNISFFLSVLGVFVISRFPGVVVSFFRPVGCVSLVIVPFRYFVIWTQKYLTLKCFIKKIIIL